MLKVLKVIRRLINNWSSMLSIIVLLKQSGLACPTQVASCKNPHGECLAWRDARACAPACMPVISAWSWSCRHMDSWLRAAGPRESPYQNILLYHQHVCTLHWQIPISFPALNHSCWNLSQDRVTDIMRIWREPVFNQDTSGCIRSN